MYVFPNTISLGFDFADRSDSLWVIIHMNFYKGLSKRILKNINHFVNAIIRPTRIRGIQCYQNKKIWLKSICKVRVYIKWKLI